MAALRSVYLLKYVPRQGSCILKERRASRGKQSDYLCVNLNSDSSIGYAFIKTFKARSLACFLMYSFVMNIIYPFFLS